MQCTHDQVESAGSLQGIQGCSGERIPEKMREIMTDNARELCMGEMKVIREQEGTKLHMSVRYSPESNGVAERTIGVLTNAVRAMLHDSGHPKSLWAEARRMYIIGRQRRRWAVVRDFRPFTGRFAFVCIRRAVRHR